MFCFMRADASPRILFGVLAAVFLAWMVFGRRHHRSKAKGWLVLIGVCFAGAWFFTRTHEAHHAAHLEHVRQFRQHANHEARARVEQRIDQALAERAQVPAGKEPSTLFEVRIRVDESEEHSADAEAWGAALWTLLDAAAQPPGPSEADLRRLEQISVAEDDGATIRLGQVGRVSRRIRRGLPPASQEIVGLRIRLDDEDGSLNLEEIALELETQESDVPAARRALASVQVGGDDLMVVAQRDRMPRLAQLPPLPQASPEVAAEAPAAPPSNDTAAATVAPLAPPAPPATPAPPTAPASPAAPEAPQAPAAVESPAEIAAAVAAAAESIAENAEITAEQVGEQIERSVEAATDELERRLERSHADAERAAERAAETVEETLEGRRRPRHTRRDGSASPEASARRAPVQLQILAERPAWIDEPPASREGVYYLTAVEGPFSSREECEQILPRLFEQLARRYELMYLDETFDLPFSQLMDEGVCREAYIGPHDSAELGTMFQVHALAGFDDRFRGLLRQVRRDALVHQRVIATCSLAGLLLGMMGTVFGYLRLDTATKGFYSGRLKLLAVSLMAVCVALCATVLALTQ